MKTSSFGILLVILGIMMVVYTGIDLITTNGVVDIGSIKIGKAENHPVHWSPVVGIMLIAGGIALELRGRKKRV